MKKYIKYFSIITFLFGRCNNNKKRPHFIFIIENKSKVGKDFPKHSIHKVEDKPHFRKHPELKTLRKIKVEVMGKNLDSLVPSSGICVLSNSYCL